jgi:DNA-binding MarR family transcriptional regulator
MHAMTGDGGPAQELYAEIVRFVRISKSANVAHPDQSALLLLWPLLHEGPMRLRDLARSKGVDAFTVSRQAAHLVREGLVKRDPDPDDGRATLLDVTDAGRQFCSQLMESRRQAIQLALSDWPVDKVCQFAALLRDFNLTLQAQQAFHTQAPGGARTQETE